jgi:hypothetical protein
MSAVTPRAGIPVALRLRALQKNPGSEKTVLELLAPLLQRHRLWLKAGLGYLRLQRRWAQS